MKKKNFMTLIVVMFVIAVVFSFISLIPFVWSFLTSLKPVSELSNRGFDFSKFTFGNYKTVLTEFPFARWFMNSAIVALIVTFGNVIINSLAGYALARMDFKGNTFLFYMTIGLMMVPSQVLISPTYLILMKIGWIDTYAALTVPFLFNLFNIFLMRQFFLSIPKELEEAAQIDGLGPFGTFIRIVLPISKPALVTQTILVFSGNWNSYLWPSLLVTSEKMYTMPVGLNSFYGLYYQYWNTVMTGVVLLTLPSFIVFVFFQKYYKAGISTSGLKG